MSQTLPINDFKWVENISEFNESFIESCNEESDEGYFLEVIVQYPERLHDLHYDLSFLLERTKIKRVKKLVANLYNKTQYIIHIRNLKKAINHGLVLKMTHRVIKFNQKAWLKSYIDRSTDLRKKILKKTFSRWGIIQFLEKLLRVFICLFSYGLLTKILGYYK